jgi:hypothetical protein
MFCQGPAQALKETRDGSVSRRHSAEKREILPDPKFGDLVISKFMNSIMHAGKKSVAEHIVYGALERVEARTRQDPVQAFHDALNNVAPSVEVRSRRVGGAFRGLRISWLIVGIRPRPSHSSAGPDARWVARLPSFRPSHRTPVDFARAWQTMTRAVANSRSRPAHLSNPAEALFFRPALACRPSLACRRTLACHPASHIEARPDRSGAALRTRGLRRTRAVRCRHEQNAPQRYLERGDARRAYLPEDHAIGAIVV